MKPIYAVIFIKQGAIDKAGFLKMLFRGFQRQPVRKALCIGFMNNDDIVPFQGCKH